MGVPWLLLTLMRSDTQHSHPPNQPKVSWSGQNPKQTSICVGLYLKQSLGEALGSLGEVRLGHTGGGGRNEAVQEHE